MYNFIFQFLDLCNTSTIFFQFSSYIVSSLPLEGNASRIDHSLAHIAATTDSLSSVPFKTYYVYITAMNERGRMRPKIGDSFWASLRKCRQ